MFPIPQTPHKRCKRTDVNAISPYVYQVRGDAVQLTYQYTDVFNPFRNLPINAEHSLNAHDKRMTVVHESHIVHPVGKWNGLPVVHELSLPFNTTMQVHDRRDDDL